MTALLLSNECPRFPVAFRLRRAMCMRVRPLRKEVDMRGLALDVVTREQRPDSFWCLLSPEERRKLADVGEVRPFTRQNTLIRAAATGSCVAVVLSGRVRVLGEDGERVVATRFAGDIIGEQAFLDNGVRSATVVAVTNVRALVLTGEQFDRVVAEHPGVLRLLGAVVSKRLRESDASLLERGGGAADKVRRFLVGRAAAGPVIHIGSQEELARELDISRSSVGRALAQLKRNNLVSVDRARISIRDLAELKRQIGL
ncbi:Crp/Fnr family transcriptional regulator [Lentzea sp. NPDC003310]|uniref:Crp/Fnr family transcriptional regulator n=1 Tax=Lentzea sp. NPDC003310 TaxID=3154447 RepID=UPI0033AA7428